MRLSSAERRALAAKGNRLKARVIIRANELSDATVAHVRQAFGDNELIKVRISTDDRQRCLQAAQEIAERIPCELVQRVGRVALLYRPADEADDRRDDRDDSLNGDSNSRRDQP
jgi:RNA-binding protein